PEPRETTRSIKVKLPAGKKRVKVEYSYWPNTYTNIIRGRQVELAPGKKNSIDLTKKEAGDAELIKPIYVPTPVEVVQKMCEVAKIRKGDVVYDIGCGDGRLVIMAVKKFGAKKGVGIDINADLIKKCKANAKDEGVSGKTEFKSANALEIKDWSEADVVLLYLG